MKVNCDKTQLLLVSPPNGYANGAFLDLPGGRIASGSSMKLLGFVFGQEPNVNMHMKEIQRKFRARFWALIHLKKAGFKGRELFDLYSIFVRPVIEFCGIIYHSLLTSGQTADLERLQRQVVKLAFGWDISYSEACDKYDIETLEQRRKNSVDKFVIKTTNSERFAENWYPLRITEGPEIRDRRVYYETFAKTKRYYNSPLAYMRRRANDLLSSEQA